MDTSETNIKMCEKAWPDLKREFRINDIVYCPEGNRLCIVRPALDGKAEQYLTTILLDKPIIFLDTEGFFIVWSQDQLQEMVLDNYTSPRKLAWEFGMWAHDLWDAHELSMKQLWLAFVMKKKHNKVLDGEDWVNIEE